jgi:Cation transport ATPase
VVRPGDRIPTDGVVREGQSAVDRSLVTGESVPVEVNPGDSVIGGTINAHGRLVIEATRVGADTHLARMATIVERAQNGKARAQRLADAISSVFVPIVIVLALLTLAGWLIWGPSAEWAFRAAVATLIIIACPCALGLRHPNRPPRWNRQRGGARDPPLRTGGPRTEPPCRHTVGHGQDRGAHHRRDERGANGNR